MSIAVEAKKRVACPDWEAPAPLYPTSSKVGLLALIAVPAVLVALVLAVFTGWWWVAVAVLVLWGLKTAADGWSRDPLMLKRVGAQPLAGSDAPRLHNIISGVAAELGVPPPDVYVIARGGPNAFVRRGGRGGILAVTRPVVDDYTRTEQEAVVVHCLLRMNRKDFLYSNLAARWSDLGAGLAPRVGLADDVQAAACTRYPPALASALEKADPKVKRYTPLWFAAISPSHDDTMRRAAAVSEL